MPIIEKNNIKYYTIEFFNDKNYVKHCMSTRVGGVSKDQFSSMNLGFTRGDDDNNVLQNYRLLCEAAGFTMENIVMPNQVHGTDIVTITSDMLVKNEDGKSFHKYDFGSNDGLITKEKNICLAAFSADCVPIFYIDTVKKAIGVAHAGWRGTADNVAGALVSQMIKEFNSNPKDIIAGIGPSINQCCFEVDEDVADEFKNKLSWSGKFIEEKNNKFYINLQLINKENLINAGLLEENIEVSDLCTSCNQDLFYSHRVMGVERGSQVSLIELV